MNKEEIQEILNKLSNRKQVTLLQGIRKCQLKNVEHPFITKEEYIDKILKYINDLQNRIDKAIEYINHYETIRGYYEYEENGYDEYNYEDDLKQELLEILKGDKNDKNI